MYAIWDELQTSLNGGSETADSLRFLDVEWAVVSRLRRPLTTVVRFVAPECPQVGVSERRSGSKATFPAGGCCDEEFSVDRPQQYRIGPLQL